MLYSTWSWGNKLLWGYNIDDDANLRSTYEYVVKSSVNWFDTADSYGTGALIGRSEELLGQFSNSSKMSKPAYICTKLAPFPWVVGKQAMLRKLLASEQRLCRSIDMVQLYWPPTWQWQEDAYLQALAEGVQTGHANQIGLSNFGPRALRRVTDKLEAQGLQVYTNQVQFSLLSRQPLINGIAERCAEQNIRLIGYSPLALGLLADKYSIDRLPKGPRAILFREYLPVIEPLLTELRDIARARMKTVSQVVLNWSLNKGILPLVGVRSVEQVSSFAFSHFVRCFCADFL